MSAKVTSGPRCVARTGHGTPCGMPPLRGTDRCFNHSPDRARQRANARKRGGRQRRTPFLFPPPTGPTPLRDVASIQAVLERVMSETLVQPNGHQRSRTIAALLTVSLRTLEFGEFEARLTALEGPRSRAQVRGIARA